MELFNVWIILGIATIVLLTIYQGNRNAVWGGFTIGIIVGLVIVVFSDFGLWVIGKSAIVGVVVGFGAELLGKVSDKIRK
jgi:hypothetical protein